MNLLLEANTSNGHQVALKFHDLFKVEVAGSKELNEVVTFIHRCRRILWPVFEANPKYVKSERDMMLDITSEILVHLCHEVTLEKRYRSFVRARNPTLPRPLTYSPLGLGSKKTWHGTPDTQVRVL